MYEVEFKNEFKKALKKIKEYDNIVVFRHQRPDGDAFGSQLGLAFWLKDSFPSKTIHFVGKNSSVYGENVFTKMEEVDDDFFNNKFLAIICDTGNTARIDDERWQKADYKIKFDHHPNDEPYGDLNIVANEIASCSELIADFIFFTGKKYPMSKLSAMYLFDGITTDSGRFLFSSVTSKTHRIAAKLIDVGIVPSYDCFNKLYEKDVDSLIFQKYVLNNMVFTGNGIAYYVLTEMDLKELNIDNERGKEHLSLMSNIKGIEIWFCVTEIVEKNEWRVSIRSKKIDISEVAKKYNGGGHMQASGATLYSLDEMSSLIKDLEELI